jgi:hypothetical protein
MVTTTALCLLLAFGSPGGVAPSGHPEAAPSPSVLRLRTVSGPARALLTEALARSPTIVRMVRTLQDYRVFVLIDTRVDPDVPTGQTSLMASTPAGRYIHVVLNPALMRDRRIELLGHELQHALEIARADDVQDGVSLRHHFIEIGRALGTARSRDASFETDAARDVELQVRRDLSGKAPSAI